LSLTGRDPDVLGADQPFSIDSGRRRFRLRRACPVRFAPGGEPLLQELPKATQFSKLRAHFLWGSKIQFTPSVRGQKIAWWASPRPSYWQWKFLFRSCVSKG